MPKPFMGESMTCCVCGKQRQSDPHVESNWTMIELPDNGGCFYVCPDELPLSDRKATRWDYQRAYERIFRHIAQLKQSDQQ